MISSNLNSLRHCCSLQRRVSGLFWFWKRPRPKWSTSLVQIEGRTWRSRLQGRKCHWSPRTSFAIAPWCSLRAVPGASPQLAALWNQAARTLHWWNHKWWQRAAGQCRRRTTFPLPSPRTGRSWTRWEQRRWPPRCTRTREPVPNTNPHQCKQQTGMLSGKQFGWCNDSFQSSPINGPWQFEIGRMWCRWKHSRIHSEGRK